MRRALLTALALVLVLVAGLALWPAEPESPPATADPPAERAPPAAAPRPPASRVRLSRPPEPDRAAPSVLPPDLPVGAEEGPAAELVPIDLDGLPPDAHARITSAALQRISELHEACAPHAPAEGALVLAEMTVDEGGLLHMDLAAYDEGLGAVAVDDPLPEELVDCIDDVLWEMDWPPWDKGLQFALTTRFEPETQPEP